MPVESDDEATFLTEDRLAVLLTMNPATDALGMREEWDVADEIAFTEGLLDERDDQDSCDANESPRLLWVLDETGRPRHGRVSPR